MTTLAMKPIPIELDTPLQGYAAADELGDAKEKYDEVFGVDASELDMAHYYPWKLKWFSVNGLLKSRYRRPKNLSLFGCLQNRLALATGFMIKGLTPLLLVQVNLQHVHSISCVCHPNPR